MAMSFLWGQGIAALFALGFDNFEDCIDFFKYFLLNKDEPPGFQGCVCENITFDGIMKFTLFHFAVYFVSLCVPNVVVTMLHDFDSMQSRVRKTSRHRAGAG